MRIASSLSIIRGIPLQDEAGLGALTLPGYLREVTDRYADREALVMHHPDGSIERWSYRELWQRSMDVACALVACGVGKDSRVGVLMTNRPEWIAAFFGIGMAGGVAVAFSTFSTPAELEHLLQASSVSTLLFERRVLKKDFAEILIELEPGITDSSPGDLSSTQFPYLRRIVGLGEKSALGIEIWSDFIKHGAGGAHELVHARIDSIRPADAGVLFFSSGSTGRPKGILSTHRGVAIQCWRWRRMLALGDDVRAWTANGFFWSGNFAAVLGATLSAGGSLVLQPTFDPVEALRLMQAERVTRPFAWPHQYEQIGGSAELVCGRFVQFSLCRSRQSARAAPDGVNDLAGATGVLWKHGDVHALHGVYRRHTPRSCRRAATVKPLPGNTIKIVDPLTGVTVPRGERGEIAVKGPTLMLGYVGVPVEETFDAEGFFRTGDGGYIDARGRLVLGRPTQRHHQDGRRQCFAGRGGRGPRDASRHQGESYGRCAA